MAKPKKTEQEQTYEPITAFAVVKVGALFQPCRLHIAGDEVKVEPLHDAMPYEALAYEFLQGDVMNHYAQLQIERSRPCQPKSSSSSSHH